MTKSGILRVLTEVGFFQFSDESFFNLFFFCTINLVQSFYVTGDGL